MLKFIALLYYRILLHVPSGALPFDHTCLVVALPQPIRKL